MESGRGQDRKAVGLLVRLKHQNVDTFVEQYATNLSPGGMFIRASQPQAVGTRIKFDIQIAGGVRVMKGTAVVRWTRQPNDPAGPPGMGVQFEELDPSTRALVDRMLSGGKEPEPAPEAAAANDAAAELEAQLRAQYGDPSKAAKSTGSLPPIAVAPVVAPIAPVASASDEIEIPIEMEGTSRPTEDSIDLPLDALIAETPAPAPEEPPDFLAAPSAGGDLPDLFGDVELPPADEPLGPIELAPAAKAPAPAPAEEEAPLELELASIEAEVEEAPAAPPPPPPAARAAPPPPPAAKPPPSPPPSMPSALANAQVRREDPTAKVPAPPPTLAKPAEAKPPPPPPPRAAAATVFLTPPETIDATGPVIGIDLGTTNSCVGILVNGKPTVMRSKQGYNTLPSIVALTQAGKVLVAHPARNQMVLNPSRTIYGAKRLVGRPFDSPTVKQVKERFHYEVCPDGAGRAAVRLGDHVLSLEEVQGLILKECKEMAEREMGKPVSRAVITCPAYYSEPQREAVRKAGAMAGLKVERVLNEPTAAALAFGMNRELNRKILVYDLGGGTFDATLLKIEKNVFEVLATGGDTFLGGTDFDNTITDVLIHKFEEQHKVPLQADSVALSRVTELAEKAKCALSERNSFDVHIPMLTMDPSGGAPKDLRCTITREELEKATLPLIERSMDVVRDVLLDAKLQAKDVDDIILVGGQSRMPLVREKLKALFGKQAHAGVNADEAVALGAALYSGSVDKVSSVVLIDVLPMTIGVAMPGGGFKRVIERNTPLPAQRSFAIGTTRDYETSLEFQVFQGEDNNVAGNEYLGTVRIEELPRAPKGVVKAAVTLRLDSECVLHVEGTELSTHKAIRATLATRYTPDEVQKKLGVTVDMLQKANARRAQELEGRGGGFWGKLKGLFGRKK